MIIASAHLMPSTAELAIPRTVSHILFERKYQPEQMITLVANVFRNILISSAKLKGKEFQPGVLATLHKAGNGVNMNQHVHLIGTRKIIDTKTGEIMENVYMAYKKIRHVWKEAFLNHLVKQNILTA